MTMYDVVVRNVRDEEINDDGQRTTETEDAESTFSIDDSASIVAKRGDVTNMEDGDVAVSTGGKRSTNDVRNTRTSTNEIRAVARRNQPEGYLPYRMRNRYFGGGKKRKEEKNARDYGSNNAATRDNKAKSFKDNAMLNYRNTKRDKEEAKDYGREAKDYGRLFQDRGQSKRKAVADNVDLITNSNARRYTQDESVDYTAKRNAGKGMLDNIDEEMIASKMNSDAMEMRNKDTEEIKEENNALLKKDTVRDLDNKMGDKDTEMWHRDSIKVRFFSFFIHLSMPKEMFWIALANACCILTPFLFSLFLLEFANA